MAGKYSASDETREHYLRPEVRETILRFCQDGPNFRALNGDEGWYISADDKEVRLRSPDDYVDTIEHFRTLYCTLDSFESSVKAISQPWDESKKAPAKPIGTFKECTSYTLGADIDSIPPKGKDIRSSPETKRAVEAMATFLIAKLKEAGITRSIHCLYSGGGIYVFIHHELFKSKPNWSPDDGDQAFRSLTSAYNCFLADVEEEFFSSDPKHKGRVKIDKINNQKRKFKCVFSIHKKLPLAVVPLDPTNIQIDFEKAKLPLSDDTISEGDEWYRDYDPGEKEALKALLKPYVDIATRDLQARKERSGNYEIKRRSEPLSLDSWPPCMKNILEKIETGKGPHRACAVLASFLYQSGWSEKEAFEIWSKAAENANIESRIFDCWYGQMLCPNCSTIQEDSSGYPKVGLAGLEYCCPDEKCEGCKWPGGYANEFDGIDIAKISEDELGEIIVDGNPKLEIRLEPDNIISQYVEYGKSTCDAYTEYHYGIVLALISIATNRNLVLKLRQGDVFPNIWLFMLGRSTISRKSAAMQKGQAILNSLFSWCSLPQSYSPEGIIEILSEKPKAYLLKDEAAAMLAAMQKNYMLEMRDLYCVLYDCQSYSRSLRRNQRKEKTEFKIIKPFISLICATTPENFKEYSSLLDLTSGWLLRFLYIYPTYRKKWMPFKPKDEEDFQLYGAVTERILRIKKILYNRDDPVNILLTPEAWTYYQTWQETRENELQETTNSIDLALWGRLSFYALKLAMLFTVGRADYDEDTPVSIEHVMEACRQVDEYFLPIGRRVAEEVAREETKNLQNKILGTLARNGGKMKRRDLLRNLHAKLKDVDEALEALIASEEVCIMEAQGKGKAAVWILLNQINISGGGKIKPKPISIAGMSQVSHMSQKEKRRTNSDSISGIDVTDATHGTFATTETRETAVPPGKNPNESPPSDFKCDIPEEGATCPICGVEIGPGHSSSSFEGRRYCATCPTHFSTIRECIRDLCQKDHKSPTTTEIYKGISLRSTRPPKEELLPLMLEALGFKEVNSRWEEKQIE